MGGGGKALLARPLKKITLNLARNPNFMSSLLSCDVFLFFFIHFLQSLSKFKIFIIKIPKVSLFILLVLNAVFITIYHAKAVHGHLRKNVPIWLHHTVRWTVRRKYSLVSFIIYKALTSTNKNKQLFFSTNLFRTLIYVSIKLFRGYQG